MARDNIQQMIREALLADPDGVIVRRLAERINKPRQVIQRALHLMADAYIDRWEPATGPFGYAAVWCVVEVPADCPRPR
jgi:hypothetical protein